MMREEIFSSFLFQKERFLFSLETKILFLQIVGLSFLQNKNSRASKMKGEVSFLFFVYENSIFFLLFFPPQEGQLRYYKNFISLKLILVGFMSLMLHWSSYMDSLLNKGLPRTLRHNPPQKKGKRRERECHFSRVLWVIYCWKAPLNNKVIIEQAGLS